MSVVRALYPYNYSIVSDANDEAVAVFQKYLDFFVHEFRSGSEVNGWIVPNNWEPIEATISHEGNVILDAMQRPLGVGVLSPSFRGTLDQVELKQHLFFSTESPNAIPYHWSNLYRPADQDWALCVTKKFFDSLPAGEFEVNLDVKERTGSMKVLDFVLAGESDETIILNAHNCHPFQANDDISGCAVAIGVLSALRELGNRRFTYRLVIAPELIGTVHWLDAVSDSAGPIVGALLLKSVGNSADLRLQHSFLGKSQLDIAAGSVLTRYVPGSQGGGFRTVYGNDETVFDSPGYEIPSISLTRYPFNGYHTDADTPESLSVSALDEAMHVVLEILEALERNLVLRFSGRGLVSLSHPRYGLYRAAPAPGLDRQSYDESERRWNLFMNCLPRELDGTNSSIDLAQKYGLPVLEVCEYLEQWHSRSLGHLVRDSEKR